MRFINQFYSFLLVVLLLNAFQGVAQIQVDNTVIPSDIVTQLVGEGISFSNVTFSGDLNQFGSFTETGNGLGIASGAILGTGDVELAEGPNDAGGASLGGGNFGASDPDLESISGVDMNDVAILEFDFVPLGDVVSFHYVFASEEYNEYVCGTVNDAFGFFLSGPGISGSFSSPTSFPDGSVNIALIPGGNIGVSIGTVNNGTVGLNGQASNCFNLDPNWQSNTNFYVDNTNANFIQYDGMTVVMEATHAVECGETYHIKLAIGDGGDSVFDSGVFLEENSFSSNVPTSIALNIVQATEVENGVYENCGGAALEFVRENNLDTEMTIGLIFSGDAELGTDYLLPDSISFAPNESLIYVNFQPFQDNITEPVENVVISISFLDACLNVQTVDLVELFIVDVTPMTLTTQDIPICGEDVVSLLPVVTGGVEPYSFAWSNGESTNVVNVPTDGPEQYSVTVWDACQETDSLSDVFNLLFTEPPSITFPLGSITYSCEDSLPVLCVTQGDYQTITFTSSQGDLLGNTNPITYYTTGESETITAEIVDICNLSDEVIIPIIQEDPPELIVSVNDDISGVSCQDVNNLEASFQGGELPVNYQWTIDGEVVSEGFSYSFLTFESTYVVFSAEDHCGFTDADSVLVEVLQPPILLEVTPDLLVCEHSPITLFAQAEGGDGGFVYSWPDFGLGQTQTLSANESNTYSVTVTDVCGQTETDSVQVDVIDFSVDYELTNLDENSYFFELFTSPDCDSNCTYLWDFGDDSFSNEVSAFHTYEGLSSHLGYVAATNSQGCADSAYFTVAPPFYLFVPNSFTPDDDGVNDYFKVYGVGVGKYNIKIFNRWGTLVYESNDINDVWIGEVTQKYYYAGNEVYNWIIVASGYDATVHTKKGELTVIR